MNGNGALDLANFLIKKKAIGYKWMFTIKATHDG